MMDRVSRCYLGGLGAIVLVAHAAACSDAASNTLNPGATMPTATAPAPTAAPSGSTSTPQPFGAPPTTGPGSASSSAHQFFVAKVYPAIQTSCGTCHATGTAGAPMFLQGTADTAYQSLDARGMIVTSSSLLSKGTHAGGAAPALAPAQAATIQEWLALEAKERVGQAAPVNILEKVGSCFSQGLFEAIQWGALKTVKRTNENPDQCTDCNDARCATCHTAGDNGFYMGVASGVEPDIKTFEGTKKTPFITRYIGLSGTQPVPSYGVRIKAQAVAVGPDYSHPKFVLTPERENAINVFVSDAITKYNGKLCGN